MTSASEDIKSRLVQMGVGPKKSLGQNFLVGTEVIEAILDAVKGTKSSEIVEVGPGLGALTEPLYQMGVESLTLVELDTEFVKYWERQGFHVIEGDALKIKWETMEIEEETLLVSNLPYQIGGQLLVERSLGPLDISAMILMFQKEVAERILALPGGKEYGFLSVIAQTYWSVMTVVDAGPADFYPKPKVHSRVLSFARRPVDPAYDRRYVAFVNAAFAQRRKTLKNSLASVRDELFDKSEAELIKVFEEMGRSEKLRGEELTPEEFKTLYKKLL